MVEATLDIDYTLLPDPCGDRVLKDSACARLAQKPLDDDKLWSKAGVPNWKMLKDFLSREGPVTKP